MAALCRRFVWRWAGIRDYAVAGTCRAHGLRDIKRTCRRNCYSGGLGGVDSASAGPGKSCIHLGWDSCCRVRVLVAFTCETRSVAQTSPQMTWHSDHA